MLFRTEARVVRKCFEEVIPEPLSAAGHGEPVTFIRAVGLKIRNLVFA